MQADEGIVGGPRFAVTTGFIPAATGVGIVAGDGQHHRLGNFPPVRQLDSPSRGGVDAVIIGCPVYLVFIIPSDAAEPDVAPTP